MQQNKSFSFYQYIDIQCHDQILMFPEGKDMGKESRQKSDLFAHKYNLTSYEYVLHPRTTGFTFMVNQMRQSM